MSLFNPFSRVRFGHSLHPSFTWASSAPQPCVTGHLPMADKRVADFRPPPPRKGRISFLAAVFTGCILFRVVYLSISSHLQDHRDSRIVFSELSCAGFQFELEPSNSTVMGCFFLFVLKGRVVASHHKVVLPVLLQCNGRVCHGSVHRSAFHLRAAGALPGGAGTALATHHPAEDAPICIHGMPLRFRRCAVDLFHPSWAKWGSGIPEPKIFSSLPLCVGKLLFF